MTNAHFKVLLKIKKQIEIQLEGKCNDYSKVFRLLRKRLHDIELEIIQDIHDNDLDYLPK